MSRLVWIPVAAFVVLFVGLVVATQLGAVDFDWAIGVIAFSGCGVEVCVGLGFAWDWWREAHPPRPGHVSSSEPYMELPKVSGRPAAGASVRASALGMVSMAEATENLRNLASVLGRNGAAPDVPPGHVALHIHGWGTRIVNQDGKDVTDWASCRPVDPIGPCPCCLTVAAHLLFAPQEVDGGRVVRRSCQSCTGSWRERLDPLTPGTDNGSED